MRLALLCYAGVLGLTLATVPASAQGYGPYGSQAGYDQDGTERLEVIAPRYHHRERSEIGAPIYTARMFRSVYIGDLDLRTHQDAHRLRVRLGMAAQTLCRDLDKRAPVTEGDPNACVRNASFNAMEEANIAIGRARGLPDE